MKANKLLVMSSLIVFVIAIVLFIYMLNISKAFSYLSSDPKACINCHVMNTQYATWQHSAHASVATCNDCHLPTDGIVRQYLFKAKDGFNHGVAFTFNTYKNAIKISEDAETVVQENCISCHSKVVATQISNSDYYHNFDSPNVATGRKCWECHQEVPHGKVRGLTTTPGNLGVMELK